MKTSWKDRTIYEKILTILIVLFSIMTITLAILEKFYNLDSIYSSISLSTLIIIEGILYSKHSKKVCMTLILLAVISLILSLI